MGDGRESSIHIDIKWDRGAVTEMFSNCQLPAKCGKCVQHKNEGVARALCALILLPPFPPPLPLPSPCSLTFPTNIVNIYLVDNKKIHVHKPVGTEDRQTT